MMTENQDITARAYGSDQRRVVKWVRFAERIIPSRSSFTKMWPEA